MGSTKPGGGKRRVAIREVINGVMYILSTGCQWRALPKDLPILGCGTRTTSWIASINALPQCRLRTKPHGLHHRREKR